jgi:predicted phage terminase large subunit-like protein
MTRKDNGLPMRLNLIDALSRVEFYPFVRRIFPIVSAGDRFLPNWHIEAITYALTCVMRGEIKRLVITVPPRSLKSICASVAFPAFVLGHNPARRIICVSYAEKLARKHANDCRAVMRSSLYRRLFPGTRISAAKDTELEVVTTARGFRYATSVGGTLTGRGGNLLILDDPLSADDAHSERARESLRQWYGNTLLSRLDNKVEDAIIVVTQRLHVDDLVGHLLEEGDWAELNLPAIAEIERPVPIGPGKFHHRKPGDVLHPEREPAWELEKLKRKMGSADFAAQYQQQPVPPSGNLIKWAWFRVYDKPPMRDVGDHTIVSWDTAMSPGELSDYSACVVLHVKGEDAFILEVVRERLDYPDLRRKTIDLHRRWRNHTNSYALLIEDKGSGMSLMQDLKAEGIRAIPVKPIMDKVMRMNGHLARIEAGCVHLPRQAPWLDDLRKELMEFPVGRFDDQVDAFSQALDRAFLKRGFMTCRPLKGLY